MKEIINIEKDDIIIGPSERKIAMNIAMVFFRVKPSSKTAELDTGRKFRFDNKIYQIMNREKMHDENDYLNINCWILPLESETTPPPRNTLQLAELDY